MKKILFKVYGYKNNRLRNFVLRLCRKIDGNEFTSTLMRDIFAHYHQVTIGLHSHGGCFTPGALDPQTTIGRYCSIAHGVRVFNRDHPVNFKAMHAYFFNPRLGYSTADPIPFSPLTIGNDVWIGTNATITASVGEIGDGAVIGAGANVARNIPPYAIAVGNPARVVKFRFSKETIEALLQERWWDKPLEELLDDLPAFQTPLA